MTERFTLLRNLKCAGVIFSASGLFMVGSIVAAANWGGVPAFSEQHLTLDLLFCFIGAYQITYGIFLVAQGARTAVVTGRRSLFLRGILSQVTIPWTKISRACWSSWSPGVTVYWPGGRRKITLPGNQGRELLRILRSRIDDSVQEGWNAEQERLFNPPRFITQ